MPHLQTSSQSDIFHLGYCDYTCNWGTHICVLYSNKEERDEIIHSFLHAGNNSPTDFVFLGLEEEEIPEFFEGYDQQYPDDRYLMEEPNKCKINTTRDQYYPNDLFSADLMVTTLKNTDKIAKENGFKHVRGLGDMIWSERDVPGKETMMEFEARVNLFIKDKPWCAICMYDTTRFSGATILQVLQTHPFVINNGVITENPFYIDAEKWLEENVTNQK